MVHSMMQSSTKISTHTLEEQLYEKTKQHHNFGSNVFLAIVHMDENHIMLGCDNDGFTHLYRNEHLYCIDLRSILLALTGKNLAIEYKRAPQEVSTLKKRLYALEKAQQRHAIMQEETLRQKQEGRCELVPFPLEEHKVRSDLTIEQHAIFAANTYKGNYRVFTRTFRPSPSSDPVTVTIEVGDKYDRIPGVLKQKHQEAFYKLSQIWSEQEYCLDSQSHKDLSLGAIKISAYELVCLLRTNDSGQNYKSVLQLLQDMSNIRVKITRENLKTNEVKIQDFSLLSYEWQTNMIGKRHSQNDTESQVKIWFSNFVTENFLKKHVKALLVDPYLGLKDKGRKGVAQLIYTMLDYELSSKESFNISLRNLAERLGTTQYSFKSKRKEKMESSIEMVNNSPILDGAFKVNCFLSKSDKKNDWILMAKRTPISGT